MMSAQVKKRSDWKSVDGASESPRRLHLEKPQISVIIALFRFETMKDLEARGDAENMSRQSMDGIYILIPSLILGKLRRSTCQYGQQ